MNFSSLNRYRNQRNKQPLKVWDYHCFEHDYANHFIVWLGIRKDVYREEGMQLTMYPTYSSDFVSETEYAKNRIQYTDVNKWAVLFTEL